MKEVRKLDRGLINVIDYILSSSGKRIQIFVHESGLITLNIYENDEEAWYRQTKIYTNKEKDVIDIKNKLDK